MAPLIAGLIVAMPKLIDLLYLPVYQRSGLIGSILAVGVWVAIIEMTYGAVCFAGNKPQYISFATATKFGIFLLLVFPFFDSWGINGVAIAAIMSQIGLYVFSAIGAHRLGFSRVFYDIVISAVMVGFSYFLYLLSAYAQNNHPSPIISLAVIFVTSCSISAAVMLLKSKKKAIS